AAVLSRLAGQPDVVIGVPTANRVRPEVEGLIGFFVNTLALRVDLSGGPTVDGEPVQHIAPVEESGFRLVEHDLHASADAEDALRRLMADQRPAGGWCGWRRTTTCCC
ncbi:MAG TPA: condensation domain-containing protein, partial [Longimicrobium sp.]|nr:condensation domain-containing protein [Longimicrobium sp.]